MAETLPPLGREAQARVGKTVRLGEDHITQGAVLLDEHGQLYVVTANEGKGLNPTNRQGVDHVTARTVNLHGNDPVLTQQVELKPGESFQVQGFWDTRFAHVDDSDV